MDCILQMPHSNSGFLPEITDVYSSDRYANFETVFTLANCKRHRDWEETDFPATCSSACAACCAFYANVSCF
ncbi:unnamed protein product [Oikopleura dioica]|uniref:Uncharacterized protein n=1 Tax=Oikopleura dioica TaxID=34765 RepID=E4XCK1_OIKDI|nr:unnamed protein product [Oikopleura dioica]